MNSTINKSEETLKVFVRVRPPIYKEVKLENAVSAMGGNSVIVNHEGKDTSCTYHHVFNELTEQEQIFEKIKPVLVDTLAGINSCIFAYGQTSSGKSYTMIGPNGGQDLLRCDRSLWGILPRAAEFLLGYLNDKAEEGVLSYEVKASFLQIYNENLYDLLRDSGPMIEDHLAKDSSAELKIREAPKPKSLANLSKDSSTEIYVSGLSEFRVQTAEDILHILTIGTTNRMTRSTDFNLTSSRSHALLTLTFEIEQQVDSGQTLISRSKLNLIDLAGSEKYVTASELSTTKQHVKELTSINKSLSALGNVIAALSANNRSHIPYRDSKLTRILQDSLGGNTKTVLIACVAPTVLHSQETLSTLQFADRAKNVRITVKANTVVDDKITLAKAQAEISRLKSLLAHTMKQLQARDRGLNGGGGDGDDGRAQSATDIEKIIQENEELRRENDSLRRITIQQAGGKLPGIRPSRSLDALTSPRASKALFKKASALPNEPQDPKSGRKGAPGSDNKSKVGFSSGLDRFGRRLTFDSDNNGNMNNGNNNIKPKKIRPAQKGVGAYDSDGEREMASRRNKVSAYASPEREKPRPTKKNDDDRGDLSDNNGIMSKFQSKLYRAINDRQAAELNQLMEEANRKILEQHMKLLSEPKRSTSPKLRPAAITIEPANSASQSRGKGNDFEIQIFAKEPPPRKLPEPEQPDQQPPVQQQQLQQPPQQQNNTYQAQDSSRSNPTPKAAAQFYQLQHHHQMQQMVQQQGTGSNGTGSALNTPGRNNITIPPQYAASIHPQQVAAAMEPNNRIFLKAKPLNEPKPVTLTSVPETIVENHFQKPEVYQSNSSAMNSVNLFANAVSMYANANKAKNIMLNPGQPLQQPSQGSQFPGQQQQFQQQFQEFPMQHQRPQIMPQLPQQQQQSNRPQQQATQNPMMMAVPHGSHQSGGEGNQSSKAAIPANLTGTMDDIGRGVEMFSYRLNNWERIDLVDFDPSRKMYKCQYPNGNIQWLDLTKKPVRGLPDEVMF